MEDFGVVLSWLGMSQYLERLKGVGFDSWEALQEITEGDMEILKIDLGYRRRLQREIANAKGISFDISARFPGLQRRQMNVTDSIEQSGPMRIYKEGKESAQVEVPTKRFYRHHPKSDNNAPERPYSAYVLFANDVREKLKDENLPFPELSRRVGLQWQSASPEEKEHWRQMVAGPWEEYKRRLSAYRRTDEYREYTQYVEDFKAKHKAKEQRRPAERQQGSRYLRNSDPAAEQTSGANTGRVHNVSCPSPRATSLPSPHSDAAILLNGKGLHQRPQEQVRSEGPIDRTSLRDLPKLCGLCRQKTRDCNGKGPAHQTCTETKLNCFYTDDTQNLNSTHLLMLSQKLDASAKLLARIKPQLTLTDQQCVESELNKLLSIDADREDRTSDERGSSAQAQQQNDGSNGSEEDHGELTAGLTGSLDHVNQDDFGSEGTEVRPRAYVGSGSDLQWLRTLNLELEERANEQGSTVKLLPDLEWNFDKFVTEDTDKATIGEKIDPFGLPIKSTADQLVASFFKTIHPSFPILDKSTFLLQYKILSSTWYVETFEDQAFITMLQLVFAIGAAHAHLIGSQSFLTDCDHLLFSARARILSVDSNIFSDVAHRDQVQVFGLGAMYSLVSDCLDRSWYLSGLALRCAQSLGMHLQDITASIPVTEKRIQAQIWFALTSFETCLCMMTGRPSLVQKKACTVSLPNDMNTYEETTKPSNATFTLAPTFTGFQIRGMSAGEDGPNPQSLVGIEAEFFRLQLALTQLVQDVLHELYGPKIREGTLLEVHDKIQGFDKRLKIWQGEVKNPFKCPVSNASATDPVVSYNVALTLFFHTVNVIINRPCLCKVDTKLSTEYAHTAIIRCVSSSRSIIKLMCVTPFSVLLHHSPMWWMLFHHHKRALAVIFLELAFRADHMPALREDLLFDAKAGVEWIGRSAPTSDAAQCAHTAMKKYLQLTARLVGVDRTSYSMDFANQDSNSGNQQHEHQRRNYHHQYHHYRPSQTQQHLQRRQQELRQPASTFSPTDDQYSKACYSPSISSFDFLDHNLYTSNPNLSDPDLSTAFEGSGLIFPPHHHQPLEIVGMFKMSRDRDVEEAGLGQEQSHVSGEQRQYHCGGDFLNVGSF